MRLMLPKLNEYFGLRLIELRDSILLDVLENLLFILSKIKFLRSTRIFNQINKLFELAIQKYVNGLENESIWLSHRTSLPITDWKVWWFHSLPDPRMLNANFGATESFEMENWFRGVSSRANKILVSTESEKKRHVETFPELASKFISIPFFQPEVNNDIDVVKRQESLLNSKAKFLFVGNDGHRKGLDLIIAAFSSLNGSSELHLVGKLKEEELTISNLLSDVTFHGELNRGEVLKLMLDCNIFVMPSRFETYGLVFIEAMSSGMAIIGPHWEVQSEILDFGRAGILVKPEHQEVEQAMKYLAASPHTRLDFGMRARQRWLEKYHPQKVSNQFMNLIQSQ